MGYNEQILGAIDETFGTRVQKIGTREVTEDEEIRNLWQHESQEASGIGLATMPRDRFA